MIGQDRTKYKNSVVDIYPKMWSFSELEGKFKLGVYLPQTCL